jgi:hypothetical protein
LFTCVLDYIVLGLFINLDDDDDDDDCNNFIINECKKSNNNNENFNLCSIKIYIFYFTLKEKGRDPLGLVNVLILI